MFFIRTDGQADTRSTQNYSLEPHKILISIFFFNFLSKYRGRNYLQEKYYDWKFIKKRLQGSTKNTPKIVTQKKISQKSIKSS